MGEKPCLLTGEQESGEVACRGEKKEKRGVLEILRGKEPERGDGRNELKRGHKGDPQKKKK